MKKRKKKKTVKFMDGIIYYSLSFVTIYTFVVTTVWAIRGVEPPTVLTEWVYKFWGFEVFMTAIITVFKIAWKKKEGGTYGG